MARKRKHHFRKQWTFKLTAVPVSCPPERIPAYWAAWRTLADLIRPELVAIRNLPCPAPQSSEPRSAPTDNKEETHDHQPGP